MVFVGVGVKISPGTSGMTRLVISASSFSIPLTGLPFLISLATSLIRSFKSGSATMMAFAPFGSFLKFHQPNI